MKHLGYIIACFVILLNVQIVNSQGDVKIGTQVWTSKNLDVSTFRNGEAIPEGNSDAEWNKAVENKQTAWCYYDKDIQNGKKYGKLYNWYAVNDSRGLAPTGYHIPSDAEWTVLTDFLGGEHIAGEKMKSKQGWQKNGKKSGNGNNSSGFNGLPGGICNIDGNFWNVTENGHFWSFSEYNTGFAWYRVLKDARVYREFGYERNALSVRCIRDQPLCLFLSSKRVLILSDLSIKHVETYTEIKPNLSLVNEEGMNIRTIEEKADAETYHCDFGHTHFILQQ